MERAYNPPTTTRRRFDKLIHHSGAHVVDWGKKRAPRPYEIWSLYSTIVFLIYGWTSIAFFWKLPSWLKILNGWEIGVVVAYVLVSDLLESLVVLVVFVIAAMLLPTGWLGEDFAVRGSSIMYVFTFWTGIFTLNSLIVFPTRSELLWISIGLLASLGLTVFLVKRNMFVRRLMRGVSNRSIIFLYIWMPLSLLSLLVLLVRFIEAGPRAP